MNLFNSIYCFFTALICLYGCADQQNPSLHANFMNRHVLPAQKGNGPQKIPIAKNQVYDLSGYQDEGKGNPFNLFDENDFVDPRYEDKVSEHYIPITDPQPTAQPAIYFPMNKGNRIVTDLLVPYKLTEVYLNDHSSATDSIWIYTGNMDHWVLKAAFVTVGNSSLWGWRKFSLSDSSQYVMVRFSSYQKAITEMVLYGNPYPHSPINISENKPPHLFTTKMMKNFLGANYFQNIAAEWVKPFHYSRIYSFAVDFDNDNVNPYPTNKYNMLHFRDWDNTGSDYSFFFDKIVKENKGEVWFTVQGLPEWMQKIEPANNRPVTQLGMDPEDPKSYARHSNMMWNIAAYFGNSYPDPSLVRLSHPWKKNRTGVMDIYENGNEEDATWVGGKYQNPMEYFAQSTADYDGDENSMGKNFGIKNADNQSKLMTCGMIEMDTNRVRVLKFLCNTLRKDKKFIWDGGIQYHHYSTNFKYGLSPEEDSMRMKLSKVRAATYRIEPTVECFLGENGYDKNQHSRQSTPMLPGFSEEQSQAVFLLRSINATAFSGFDAYILYWLLDNHSIDDQTVYLTSGVLLRKPDGSIVPYSGWFYISTFVNALGDYSPDEIIQEKGNVWVYKYRNKLSPDSVAYFIYSPTHNGTKVENYQLSLNKASNAKANLLSFVDRSVNGKITEISLVKNKATLTVEEQPKILFLKENP